MVYFSSESNALYSRLRVNQPAGFFPAESSTLYSSLRVNQPAGFFSPEVDTIFSRLRLRNRIYFSLNEDAEPQIPLPLTVDLAGYGHAASGIGSASLVEAFINLQPSIYDRKGGEGHVDSSISLNERLPFTSTSAWTRANLGSMTLLDSPQGLVVRGTEGGTLTLSARESYTSFDAGILAGTPNGPSRLRLEAQTPSGAAYVELEQTGSGYVGRAGSEEGVTIASVTRALPGFSRLRLIKDDDRVTAMVGDEVLLSSIRAPAGRSTLRLTLALPQNLARPFSILLDAAVLRSGLRVDDRLYPGLTFSDRTFRVDIPSGETSASIIIFGPWGRTERPDYISYNRRAPYPYVGGATRGI